MEKRTFLYIVRYMGRHSKLTGVAFGVIHSDSEENATNILMDKMGNNAYGFRIMEVTDHNGEGFLAMPSGDLLAWE